MVPKYRGCPNIEGQTIQAPTIIGCHQEARSYVLIPNLDTKLDYSAIHFDFLCLYRPGVPLHAKLIPRTAEIVNALVYLFTYFEKVFIDKIKTSLYKYTT